MEETNNTNDTSQPVETPPIHPITPKPNNIYKYLLFISLIIFFGVIISFYITKSNKNSQLSNNSINNAIKPTPTEIFEENNIESPTPTIINQQIEKLNDRKSGSNIFNFEDIKVGDKIGKMTVNSISDSSGSTLPPSMENYSIQEHHSTVFIGPITVSGKYFQWEWTHANANDPPTRVGVCFEPDEESSKIIPQEATDPRYIWFCFDNPTLADKELGVTGSGKATIMVDNYKDIHIGMSAANSATLIKVINKNKE